MFMEAEQNTIATQVQYKPPRSISQMMLRYSPNGSGNPLQRWQLSREAIRYRATKDLINPMLSDCVFFTDDNKISNKLYKTIAGYYLVTCERIYIDL